MNKFAAPEEIRYAHSVLLKGKPYFEQDKIDIIECNESQDIKACPGSGKTTTLLAKLIILANRMPLPNNQGICVLTHTNVAIDEIKNKLGHKADILFKYPNHFGTIQSFVDKFLAIPLFKMLYDVPLRIIDDDYAHRQIKFHFNGKTYNDLKCIYSQIKDRIPNDIPKGHKTAIVKEIQYKFIKDLWINFNDNDLPVFCRSYGSNPIAKNDNTDIYKLFKTTRYTTFENGILSYRDAYSLAFHYIKKNTSIQNVISSRFKYLFIDEMQDADIHQLDIIKNTFDKEKTIIQCFGDHRQAIYHNKVNSEERWKTDKFLPINSSKRFGENIANVLRYVCCEKNDALQANSDVNSLTPVMIVYDNPQDVLPKFCELLSSRKIEDKTIWEISQESKNKGDTSYKIKAIGWVGQDKPDVITIKSYFSNFNARVRKKDKIDYESLKSFLKRQGSAKISDYSNKIIDVLLHILSSANIKYSNGKTNRNYTKTTLLEDFENKSFEKLCLLKSNIA
ncbi:MAG: UvrD-helicase domain-containing protein, partial [Bacteroidales bacterium]|nr:UvrD-helicase domain-containing protein [Bacteroidales bacterium]